MRWPWSRKRDTATFDSPPKPIDQLWIDMLGRTSSSPVGRTEALSVPAVQRGRNLVCSIATLPLCQHGPDNAVERSSLLEQLDPDVPNVVTLAQTLEDLLFESISWWLITAQDFAEFPVAVRHLDVGQVSLQPPVPTGQNPAPLPSGIDPRGGVVWVDGKPVTKDRIIRFDSPNPPVLKVGGRAIRRAILLDKAASMYADDPRPADYFSPADGADPVDDDEQKVILAQWKAARKERSTAYVPAALKYNTVDSPSPAELQLVELQRQASLDIANALGIDPEDLGISTTTRTYQNDVDRRRNKLNEVLAPFMRAIEHRLSMYDVTRRGYVVRFNPAEYLQPNPTDRWQVYEIGRRLGAITVEEIREAEGMPPLPAGADPMPDAPAQRQPPEPMPAEDMPMDPMMPSEASAEPAHTFDEPSTFTLDMPIVEFSVDRDNRIIEGLAVPYGQYGTKGGITFRFDRGSMQWDAANPGRVKLVFPRHGDSIGKAIQLRDTPKGLFARFKVGRGPEGDRALMSAEDGVFDGMSVGVDFNTRTDAVPDPRRRDALLVRRSDLRHVALTDAPVFDNARVTRVAASRDQGGPVAEEDTTTTTAEPPAAPDPAPAPAPVLQTFSADQVLAMLAQVSGAGQGAPAAPAPTDAPAAGDERQTVDPTRRLDLSVTDEAVPYRFDRGGNFAVGQEHVFSADLHEMALANDIYGIGTDAGKRVMGLLRATFDVDSADINELTPTIQRPDLYVDQRDFKYPIWNFINKGAPPNGVQPFAFPKFSSASGLVGDHTEGTEPSSGTFVTTNQTVTPTPISGKASITREVWDMGGNPAVSTLIFNQMVRGWREGLESAAATFLNTLTAATDIVLTAGAQDTDLADSWAAGLVALQFVRGYDFEAFVVEQQLFTRFAQAVDESGGDGIGRPLFPMIGPANANGVARSRFQTLDLGGVIAVPTWALATTTGSPNNSWLFDPTVVHGWATTPQRLEFPGTAAGGTYAPVAMVDLAIWGYKALANSDIGGVRQVIYDPVA